VLQQQGTDRRGDGAEEASLRYCVCCELLGFSFGVVGHHEEAPARAADGR
jgi:hypothetical protein